MCGQRSEELPHGPYAYLLGLHLGDGYIAVHQRGVYCLRIVCCDAYPDLMDECEMTMMEVLPNVVGRVKREGCTEIMSYSTHWPCMFPQHAPGRKHERSIVLAEWHNGSWTASRRHSSEGCSTPTAAGC